MQKLSLLTFWGIDGPAYMNVYTTNFPLVLLPDHWGREEKREVGRERKGEGETGKVRRGMDPRF